MENENFRNSLIEEFEKRSRKNSAYSLRSFAKSLAIEASSLSQILSGKRKLTDKMCIRLGSRLGYSPLKLRSIESGVRNASESFKYFKKLDDDAFKVITDWYHYALLEITHLDIFQGKPSWISRCLKLPMAKVLQAIERLKRLNYLEITPKGQWIDQLGNSQNLGNEFQSQAFSEHQRQILQKAIEAMGTIPYDQRVQSSLILAGSKARVKEAKNMILIFLEELDAFLKGGDSKDEVYALAVSLFPLSDTQSKKE